MSNGLDTATVRRERWNNAGFRPVSTDRSSVTTSSGIDTRTKELPDQVVDGPTDNEMGLAMRGGGTPVPAWAANKSVNKNSGMGASKAADGQPWTFTVWSSKTLAPIAARFGVSPAEIREANGMASNAVRPGQELIIPGWQTHTVKSGETLSALQRRYGGTVEGIARANAMDTDDVLKVKTTIAVPSSRPAVAPPAGGTEGPGEVNNLPGIDADRYTPGFLNMARVVADRDDIPQAMKVTMIAQAIHETGWGRSALAEQFNNYWGIKDKGAEVPAGYRDFLVTPSEPQGEHWERFDSEAAAVDGYTQNVNRVYYAGYEDHLDSAEDYLRHIGPVWATDTGYVRAVQAHLPEARNLLRALD